MCLEGGQRTLSEPEDKMVEALKRQWHEEDALALAPRLADVVRAARAHVRLGDSSTAQALADAVEALDSPEEGR